MRVMTFNLRTDFIFDRKNRWNNRANIVYDTIRKNNCDIIGVQEMNNIMFKDIKNNLVDFNIIGSPRTKKYFVERNDIIVSKRHTILEFDTFWLSKNPEKVGSSIWYSLYPRICTTALIRLDNGSMVRVYNTHLDCFLPHARSYGLSKIGKRIEERHKLEGIPMILMGDFNATPNSKVISKFVEGNYNGKKFVAVQEADKTIYNNTTMSKFKGKEKGMHIDYIFVSDEFVIKNTNIVKHNDNGRYPSDHYPIVAEINIK